MHFFPKTAFFLALAAIFWSAKIPQSKIQNPKSREAAWVDSVFETLSDDERIGQLFMLRAHSDKGADYENEVAQKIAKYRPGGLCFFQGTPERQAELTNFYQSLSRVPLMISMDVEWGLGHRMPESTISFPKQMQLGAIQNDSLIYVMGLEIARELRRLGVHVSFSPVCDVNCTASNPVINYRSFGEDAPTVVSKSFNYMKGLQDGGVLACAKHFPGHGDTDVDSHFGLPILPFSAKRIDSLELLPFRALVQHGVGSVMVAHLEVPAIDATAHLPTSLSQKAVCDLLCGKMGFDGLIFTDGLEMEAVTKIFKTDEIAVRALEAGNDILLVPKNVDLAFEGVKKAIESGRISKERIAVSVKKMLRQKFRLGLRRPQKVAVENIRRELNTPEAHFLKRQLIEKSLVLVRDDAGFFSDRKTSEGFETLPTSPALASISLGSDGPTAFQKSLALGGRADLFWSKKDMSAQAQIDFLAALKKYSTVVVSLHETRTLPSKNFGLTESMKWFIEQLGAQNRIVLVPFGSPYSLQYFEKVPTVLLAFTEDEMVQEVAAEAVLGAVDLSGKLPVTALPRAVFGQGLTKKASQKMRFAEAESVGMSSDTLRKLDDLAREMIASGAAPGCQILVARRGKIVYEKAFGHFDYSQTRAVELTDAYDLASVTKILATTLAVMRLHEQKRLSVFEPLSKYVPELLAFSDKKDLRIEQFLAHHAGLVAWIPFYKSTVKNGLPDPNFYRKEKVDGLFDVPIAEDLWMKRSEKDSIWAKIFASKVSSEKKYVYSDLDLLLAERAVENVAGQPLDQFLEENFYVPMGLATMCFRPSEKLGADRCPPTEVDNYFRNQTIQGHVHDMAAAQMGGVAGHAGLFSNARDAARVLQMLLDGGSAGEKTYFEKATIDLFTTRFSGSTRRGLGFDMKELDPKKSQNMSELAGPNTFGHMGFTGNAVWADPDRELIFVFLSNRTMPTMENNKLINGNFRPRAQSVVYRAIF